MKDNFKTVKRIIYETYSNQKNCENGKTLAQPD